MSAAIFRQVVPHFHFLNVIFDIFKHLTQLTKTDEIGVY